MQPLWIFAPPPPAERVAQLAAELNDLPLPLAEVLWQRGIQDFEATKRFFRPSLSDLHDPYTLGHMGTAVERVLTAAHNSETVVLYGDYDVDGTTATALMHLWLSPHIPDLHYYIPDRYTEGYGLSKAGLVWAQEKGATLLITLDCGIRATELIAEAQAGGVDVIVCDHHQPGEALPPALAILNPAVPGSGYPFAGLSGCGVAFKLCQALRPHMDRSEEELGALLDLVAVSIAADIVPMLDENRILAWHGMQVLNNSPRPALKKLIARSRRQPPLNISDVVFGLAPRINAAGRLGHAKEVVKLFLERDARAIDAALEKLEQLNSQRKSLDQHVLREALDQAEELKDQYPHSLVLANDAWHKGVLGIVAARLVETYHRPTVVLAHSESQNLLTGSARSVAGVAVNEVLDECAPLLRRHGGHAAAAGLTLLPEKLTLLRQQFEAGVTRRWTEATGTPTLQVDTVLPLQWLETEGNTHPKLFRLLQQMEPFGPHMRQPVFFAERLVAAEVTLLKGKHLRFSLRTPGGQLCKALAWNAEKWYGPLQAKAAFRMAFTLQADDYQGRKSVSLMVKDITFADQDPQE